MPNTWKTTVNDIVQVDQSTFDFPKNTQWFQTYQDQEPSKPLPVTYSPQISNEDNLDQNSPGGFPRRYMGKPKGEWFSNEGEVNEFLIDMLKNKEAALDSMTRDITASYGIGYWIDPNGKAYQVRDEDELVTHFDWINRNRDLLVNEYGIKINDPDKFGYTYFGSKELVKNGWTRVGDSSFGYIGIDTPDLTHLPSSLNSILDTIPNNKGIILEDSNKRHIELPFIDEPFNGDIQKMVNKALSQKRLGSIIDDMTTDITKVAITKQYALYIGGRLATRTLTRQKALKVCQERFPEYFARGDYAIKEEAYTVSKQASIEEVDGVPVFVNPTEQELKGFSRNLKGGHMFRGLLDQHTGDLFVWDAYEAIHQYMIQKLGLDIKYSDESPYCMYFSPSDISYAFHDQQEVRQGKKLKEYKIAKQAGDQSASVPDYLINEWKTDQIMNDTDEEPYVNHDQRDYPYGMHDSPENTGMNIGWAKDNQPYVVRLDILENPAYREDPFGIGSYNVIWYNSLPASDGIEATNPE